MASAAVFSVPLGDLPGKQRVGRGDLRTYDAARSLRSGLNDLVEAAKGCGDIDRDVAGYRGGSGSMLTDLVRVLETKVGRPLFNGYPTGVEVCPAMVHGGPFPATSDARWTSVGTRAMLRFARPICYQDFPDATLPEPLRRGNPRGLQRMVNGKDALRAARSLSSCRHSGTDDVFESSDAVNRDTRCRSPLPA